MKQEHLMLPPLSFYEKIRKLRNKKCAVKKSAMNCKSDQPCQQHLLGLGHLENKALFFIS